MKAEPVNVLQLLDSILNDEIKVLSERDINFLLENQEICVRKLLPILAFEISQIKEKENVSLSRLCGSLKLLAAFKEKKAFDWVIQMHEFAEVLEEEEDISTLLVWSDILAATISSEWRKLKKWIEDPEANEDIREACIQALVTLAAQDRLDRTLVVEYFHSLYLKILKGKIDDFYLLMFLLKASSELWPGESMEEIREIFGLGFANHGWIDLLELLTVFALGKERAIENLKNRVVFTSISDFFADKFYPSEKKLDEEDDDFDVEPDIERFQDSIYSPLPFPEFEKLSPIQKKDYQSLPNFVQQMPEFAIDITIDLMNLYPNVPSLHYYQHAALMTFEAYPIAMLTLKDWVEKFPSDLLGKIEYAHYYFRRGEPEKAKRLFFNTWTLEELYPERSSFHELERLKFSYLQKCLLSN